MAHCVGRRLILDRLVIGVWMATSLLALPAAAGSAAFSGPSIAKLGDPAKFNGQGFAPNVALTVMVKAPSGTAAGFSTVANGDGAISYVLVAQVLGAHELTVTDTGGRPLASAMVSVLP
jgi:hypothetical protein